MLRARQAGDGAIGGAWRWRCRLPSWQLAGVFHDANKALLAVGRQNAQDACPLGRVAEALAADGQEPLHEDDGVRVRLRLLHAQGLE
eukprot:14892912-Alexandrium_andersonii.AAC.1